MALMGKVSRQRYYLLADDSISLLGTDVRKLYIRVPMLENPLCDIEATTMAAREPHFIDSGQHSKASEIDVRLRRIKFVEAQL